MRLYLTSSAHPDAALTISGQGSGWANTPGNVKNYLSPAKSGANTAYTDSETANATTSRMIRRFVSPKFERDGSFVPGTISYAIARLESNAAANMTIRICITIHGTNGVARASVGTWTTATEWPTTLTAVAGTMSGGNTVAVAKDEYLSVEIGYTAANTLTTSYTGTIRAGGTDATDLASGTTGVTTRSPYVDFPTAGLEDLWTPDYSAGGATRFSAETQGVRRSTGLPGPQFTLTCWLRKAAAGNFQTWFEYGDGGTKNNHQFSSGNNDTNISLAVSNGQSANSDQSMVLDEWYKMGLTFDTVNRISVIRFQPPGSSSWITAEGQTDITPSFTQLLFGWSDAWAGEWFNGRIAAAKIWNALLTESEQDAEFGYYRAVRQNGLLCEHFMQGASLLDYSGNGHTLTAGSAAMTSEPGPPIPYQAPAGPVNPDQNNHFLGAAA